MAKGLIRFGVELDRETDTEVKKLADVEDRSKRNFNSVVLRRIARLWRENPDLLIEHRIVQPALGQR